LYNESETLTGANFVSVRDHALNQQYYFECNSTITEHGKYVAIYMKKISLGIPERITVI
jgi:hypothetical protein